MKKLRQTIFLGLFSRYPFAMSLSALDRLRLFLRPFSSASLSGTDSPAAIQGAWEDGLQRLRRVSAIVLGVPSETGSRRPRGASAGPRAIRRALLSERPHYPKTVVDVGDVICVPPFLHDEMLSEKQVAATRRELFPGRSEALPVSPLSLTEQTLLALHELNPDARLLLLGGDQSLSGAAMTYCHRRAGKRFGVLHFDAASDLVEHRAGMAYGHESWALAALERTGPQQLVQLGLRSGCPVASSSVVQVEARAIASRENEVLPWVLEHFEARGVREIYVSLDLAGIAAAAEEGMTERFVRDLLTEVGRRFTILGGDLVELDDEANTPFAVDCLKALFPV